MTITNHNEHNSQILPVEGCSECDKEIGRPIPKCYGLGKSSSVIPPPIIKVLEDNLDGKN